MQPISFNANPLASNMLEGHLAKAQAMLDLVNREYRSFPHLD